MRAGIKVATALTLISLIWRYLKENFNCRYHVMEPLNDDRADILMSYLEELERKGMPPPPTASEPNRRSMK